MGRLPSSWQPLMFRQRALTGSLVVLAIAYLLFWAPAAVAAGSLALFALVAAYEWLGLIAAKPPRPASKLGIWQWLFLPLFPVACYLAGPYYLVFQYLGLILWLLIAWAVLRFPQSMAYWGRAYFVAFAGLLLIPLLLASLLRLYSLNNGHWLLAYPFLLVWVADTGAYLAGKAFGRHKLIPEVSPGKTFEGLLGGLCASLALAYFSLPYVQPASNLNWFAFTILLVLVSILGDLFLSILKRRAQLKDTGSILPGHGGILDRFDSLLSTLPVFYLGLAYIH